MDFTSKAIDGSPISISTQSNGKNIVFDLGLNTGFLDPLKISLNLKTTESTVSIEKVMALREYSLNPLLFPTDFKKVTTSILWFVSFAPDLLNRTPSRQIEPDGTDDALFKAFSSS